MTMDSNLFVDVATVKREIGKVRGDAARKLFLPVLEGRMVQQFDCAAKMYVSGEGRTAKWVKAGRFNRAIVPHYFVRRVDAERRESLAFQPRAGFCDVTGHANERSVLAALIPSNVVCGNKVPTCRFESEDLRTHLLWIAIANSLVIDWLVRRRLSTTLNFFVWRQIPFPVVRANDINGRFLIEAAVRLSCHSPFDVFWLEGILKQAGIHISTALSVPTHGERQSMIARLDRIVAGLFNLSADEVELVRRDFAREKLGASPSSRKKRGIDSIDVSAEMANANFADELQTPSPWTEYQAQ